MHEGIYETSSRQCIPEEWRRSGLDNLVAYCVAHQLTHAMHFQLPHDIGAVCFGRLNTNPEGGSDLLPAPAFGQQLNHFPFTASNPFADHLRHVREVRTHIKPAPHHFTPMSSNLTL